MAGWPIRAQPCGRCCHCGRGVSLVKQVAAGSGVSYGLRHRFAHDTTVATVPIGYADGVPRRLASGRGDDPGPHTGAVLIGGRRCPIVGVVTMDQIVVDVGDASVAVGDEVVLIGMQTADATVDATAVADRITVEESGCARRHDRLRDHVWHQSPCTAHLHLRRSAPGRRRHRPVATEQRHSLLRVVASGPDAAAHRGLRRRNSCRRCGGGRGRPERRRDHPLRRHGLGQDRVRAGVAAAGAAAWRSR